MMNKIIKPIGTTITKYVDKWVAGHIVEKERILVIPIKLWQDLWQMAQFVEGEYHAFLEIGDAPIDSEEFHVVSWFVADQKAGPGYANLTESGAVQLATEAFDRLPRMWGDFHIHAGYSNTPPTFSTIDTGGADTWVQNAERGIFVVSNKAGVASAFLTRKVGDVKYRIPMTIEFDMAPPKERQDELQKVIEERVHELPPLPKFSYKDPLALPWDRWNDPDYGKSGKNGRKKRRWNREPQDVKDFDRMTDEEIEEWIRTLDIEPLDGE